MMASFGGLHPSAEQNERNPAVLSNGRLRGKRLIWMSGSSDRAPFRDEKEQVNVTRGIFNEKKKKKKNEKTYGKIIFWIFWQL